MALQEVNEKTFPELFAHPLYGKILSLLGDGIDSSLQVRELCKFTGLSDRTARKAIETIRRAGVCIVTDQMHGYWLPETVEELQRYIRQEEWRGRSTFYTLGTARRLYSSPTSEV